MGFAAAHHRRRRVSRALWDWRASAHRRCTWEMQRELDRLRRRGGVLGADLLRHANATADGAGEGGAAMDAAPTEDETRYALGTHRGSARLCASVRRAAGLAHRCHRRAHLRLVVRAWRTATSTSMRRRAASERREMSCAMWLWCRSAWAVRTRRRLAELRSSLLTRDGLARWRLSLVARMRALVASLQVEIAQLARVVACRSAGRALPPRRRVANGWRPVVVSHPDLSCAICREDRRRLRKRVR